MASRALHIASMRRSMPEHIAKSARARTMRVRMRGPNGASRAIVSPRARDESIKQTAPAAAAARNIVSTAADVQVLSSLSSPFRLRFSVSQSKQRTDLNENRGGLLYNSVEVLTSPCGEKKRGTECNNAAQLVSKSLNVVADNAVAARAVGSLDRLSIETASIEVHPPPCVFTVTSQ